LVFRDRFLNSLYHRYIVYQFWKCDQCLGIHDRYFCVCQIIKQICTPLVYISQLKQNSDNIIYYRALPLIIIAIISYDNKSYDKPLMSLRDIFL